MAHCSNSISRINPSKKGCSGCGFREKRESESRGFGQCIYGYAFLIWSLSSTRSNVVVEQSLVFRVSRSDQTNQGKDISAESLFPARTKKELLSSPKSPALVTSAATKN